MNRPVCSRPWQGSQQPREVDGGTSAAGTPAGVRVKLSFKGVQISSPTGLRHLAQGWPNSVRPTLGHGQPQYLNTKGVASRCRDGRNTFGVRGILTTVTQGRLRQPWAKGRKPVGLGTPAVFRLLACPRETTAGQAFGHLGHRFVGSSMIAMTRSERFC